jgi:hypothetical protein
MEYSLAVVFRIVSSRDSNLVPFSCVFRWGNSQKSGEYGACRATGMLCLIKTVWISCKEWAGALSWCSCHVPAWPNHHSKWNVPNQCLTPPPPHVLGRWHDGPTWPKSALGQRTRRFGLLRAYWNERRSPPTCSHLLIDLPFLNLCEARSIVAKNPLNLPNGFHLALAKLLAKFDEMPLLESLRHFRRK